MTYDQTIGRPAPVALTAWSYEMNTSHMLAYQGTITGAAAWPTANRAYYLPIRIATPSLVQKLGVMNGGTVSGNLDLGVYDEAGTRLVSSGSTAQSGANAWQELDVTDTVLAPGRYYVAMAMNNTTGQVLRSDRSADVLRMMGDRIQDTAFALPSSATFSVPTQAFHPGVGVWMRSLV